MLVARWSQAYDSVDRGWLDPGVVAMSEVPHRASEKRSFTQLAQHFDLSFRSITRHRSPGHNRISKLSLATSPRCPYLAHVALSPVDCGARIRLDRVSRDLHLLQTG